MKNKISQYTCPRCGYKSSKKWDMQRHLYTRMKVCPGEVDDITLTEEIKESIIKNKVYQKPEEANTNATNNTTVINSIIQNYNSFNSMLSSMDVVDRLTHLFAYPYDDTDFSPTALAKITPIPFYTCQFS